VLPLQFTTFQLLYFDKTQSSLFLKKIQYLTINIERKLFVEAIILADHSEVLKERLGEIIRSRREDFTDMMGYLGPY